MSGFMAMQYVDSYKTETEARQAFEFMSGQDDCLGGRVMPPAQRGWWEVGEPSGEDAKWRIQTFHRLDDGFDRAALLPDGCRVVLILDSQRKALGVS